MNIMDGLESLKVSHLVGIPRRERDYLEYHFFSHLYLHGMDSSVSPKEACQECSGSPHLILIKKLGRWVFYKRENLLGLWFCRPRSGGQSVNKGLDWWAVVIYPGPPLRNIVVCESIHHKTTVNTAQIQVLPCMLMWKMISPSLVMILR